MTQLAYAEFCTLVATLSETLTTRETIATIKDHHKRQLQAITPHIQDNAIINIRRNVLRRKAKLVVEGFGDLFGDYSIPSRVHRPGSGNARSPKVAPGNLTKRELRLLIDEYKHRPPKKDQYLGELERMLKDIDSFCSEEETVEVGLKRRKS